MTQTALIQIDPPKILAMHNKPVRSAKGGDFVGVVPGTAIVPVVTLEQPECDWRTHSVSRLEPVAHADRVEIGWELSQQSAESIIAQIKARAGEIISERFPQTTQLNMLADAQSIALADPQTEAMKVRLEKYRLAYAWITAVRAKSNELEAALIANGTLPDFAALEIPHG
jgi:phosphoenolpyruvate-protein kinase (PTS system EI component)